MASQDLRQQVINSDAPFLYNVVSTVEDLDSPTWQLVASE